MPTFIEDVKNAGVLLRGANRIMVIGCSGGGKSTLSQRLATLLVLPYVSADRDFLWMPGWLKREKSEERRLIAEAVAKDRWVIDGTGPSTFDLRLPRTDIVLWVRLSRWQCLWGICKRGVRYFGRTRPDMAPGCPEKFPSLEFLRYIWSFENRFVPKILGALQQYGPEVPVLQLKSRRQIRSLLDILEIGD